MTSLKHLHLVGGEVTGPIPEELGKLSKLVNLHIDGEFMKSSMPN